MKTRDSKTWLERLFAADVPVSPVASYGDIQDPTSSIGRHMRDNGYVVDVEHRDFGPVTLPASPNVYSGTPNPTPVAHMPYTGEHNMEVLVSDLGFTAQEAQAFQASGVVPTPGGPHADEANRATRQSVRERLAAEKKEVMKSRAKL